MSIVPHISNHNVDLGISRISRSNNVRDTGRTLKNIVFLELKRREGEAFIGKTPAGEIDFTTNGANGMACCQVTETVTDPATLECELASLQSVRDSHPEHLITMDGVRPISHDGIQQVYALDWLLEQNGRSQ